MAQDQNLNQIPLSTGDFSSNPSTEREPLISELGSMELERAMLGELANRVEEFLNEVVGIADDTLIIKALVVIKRKLTEYTYVRDIKKVDRRLSELRFTAEIKQHEYMNHNDVYLRWVDKYGDTVFIGKFCMYDLVIGNNDEQLIANELNIMAKIKEQIALKQKEEELKRKEETLKEKEEELKRKEEMLKQKEEELNNWEKQYDELRKKVARVFDLYIDCREDP